MRAIVAGAALAAMIAAAGCRNTNATHTDLTIALAVFPDEAARYREFVMPFERAEKVRVRLVAQTYGDILRALEAEALSGGGSLDLVELDVATLARARGWVRSLDPIVPVGARELFPDAAWQAASDRSHLLFAPHRLMWQAMIYNRVEVAAPPATWDELARFAQQHPGRVALKGALYEGATCDAMMFIWSAGGSALQPSGPGALAGMDFLAQLGPWLSPESAVFREMSVLEAQARGSVLIHFNWPFAMSYLASKGLAPGTDLSAPVPAGPEGRATALGGGYLAIPRSAPHPEAAAAFVRFLLTTHEQERLASEMGWYGSVPPPPGSREAQLYSGFTAMRPWARARPPVGCYAQLSRVWQGAIRRVLFDATPARLAIAELATGALEAEQRDGCAAR